MTSLIKLDIVAAYVFYALSQVPFSILYRLSMLIEMLSVSHLRLKWRSFEASYPTHGGLLQLLPSKVSDSVIDLSYINRILVQSR